MHYPNLWFIFYFSFNTKSEKINLNVEYGICEPQLYYLTILTKTIFFYNFLCRIRFAIGAFFVLYKNIQLNYICKSVPSSTNKLYKSDMKISQLFRRFPP